jgi:DNA (cytosine-5)-methyltransferase 1
MTAYYNENDPKAAAWLRELIKNGAIASGDVDERSIEDVLPNDLRDYTQCHFFAGIGGWPYALRLAGWPDERPVWTGSCPCQPFSAAGKGKGFADERHLWPAWFWLIQQCRPGVIFGEQVANALPWLDLVSGNLETEDYTFGAAVMGAHSVGAPHIRQRLYWVGRTQSVNRHVQLQPRRPQPSGTELGGAGGLGDVAEPACEQRNWSGHEGRRRRELADDSLVGNPNNEGSQGRSERRDSTDQRSAWASDLVDCRDGKRRPVEPGTFPLAYGVPHRVGLLRGYGNAIVPQVAAAFISAYIDTANIDLIQ